MFSASESELSVWFTSAAAEAPPARVLFDEVLPSRTPADCDAAKVPAALVFSNSLTEMYENI